MIDEILEKEPVDEENKLQFYKTIISAKFNISKAYSKIYTEN